MNFLFFIVNSFLKFFQYHRLSNHYVVKKHSISIVKRMTSFSLIVRVSI
ncbi:hypothetical protein M153_1100012767 [Pseudoloma neurophilia]|uniref:Uncharacterized protein n=1 Tax=Pseudoloma neurophilia TaxID=146866 RepID=A0A0R0M148_9MICR|nr:hypothetical protein M153_1100012767 [Pseudoloma neurophilia]